MSTEAQITHTTRKIEKALKTQEEVARNEEKLRERVTLLQRELASVRKAADAAQGNTSSSCDAMLRAQPIFSEEQRKASQHNMALSEESLEEYRKL